MNTKLKYLILIVAIAIIASFSWQSGEVMTVDYGSSGTSKYVDFGNLGATGALTQMSILAWIYPTATPNDTVGYIFSQDIADSGGSGFGLAIEDSAPGGPATGLRFFHDFSTDPGSWYADSAYTLNNWYMVAVTYDGSNVANNPILYSNGVSLGAPTEANTPVGTINDASGYPVRLGELVSGALELQYYGKLPSVLVYNRVLTPAEIADAYNSRLAIPSYKGLVFAPALYGITGANDGDTMGVTDYIYDHISGAVGTPAGSPVFRADDLLTIGD